MKQSMQRNRKKRSKGKSRGGRTLASKIGVSQETLSEKIRIVREHHPEKTASQAAGAAAGIITGNRKKGRSLLA